VSYVIGDISKGIHLLWLLAVSICFLEKDLIAAKKTNHERVSKENGVSKTLSVV
jgi:hypothetical protein